MWHAENACSWTDEYKKLSVHVNLPWGTELELLCVFFGVLSDVILLVK